MTDNSDNTPFDLREFLFDTPLYRQIQLSQQDLGSLDLKTLFHSLNKDESSEVRGYNPVYDIDTTYTVTSNYEKFDIYGNLWGESEYRGLPTEKQNQIGIVRFYCKRDHNYIAFLIYWNAKEKKLMKCGQFPSLADFDEVEVKKYRKIISSATIREFSTVNRLAANGIGIGSFTYLRRIIENLVFTTFSDHESELAESQEGFSKLRMNEKIALLKDFLPSFIVENKSVYGVLSKGVHELSEEECLVYFPVVKLAIEAILDEKVEQYNRKLKREQAAQSLKLLTKEVKK